MVLGIAGMGRGEQDTVPAPEGTAGPAECPPESTWAAETALGAFWRKTLEPGALEDAPSGLSSEALYICFVEMI